MLYARQFHLQFSIKIILFIYTFQIKKSYSNEIEERNEKLLLLPKPCLFLVCECVATYNSLNDSLIAVNEHFIVSTFTPLACTMFPEPCSGIKISRP